MGENSNSVRNRSRWHAPVADASHQAVVQESWMEHRWGSRLLIQLPLWCRVQDGALASEGTDLGARLEDISVGGGLLRMDSAARPFAHFTVHLPRPPSQPPGFTAVAAYVVRRFRGGAGIEWRDFAPEAAIEWLQFLLAGRISYRGLTNGQRLAAAGASATGGAEIGGHSAARRGASILRGPSNASSSSPETTSRSSKR